MVTLVDFKGEPITQPYGNPKRRDSERGGKPQGGMPVSRESGCVLGGRNPGVPTEWSACGQSGEAREGMMGVYCAHHSPRQEASKREKPKEVHGPVTWLTTRPGAELPVVWESLKGTLSIACYRAKP